MNKANGEIWEEPIWSQNISRPALSQCRSSAPTGSMMTPEEMQSFRESLANANRVVALCGAGLSAASGLGVHSLLPAMLT